MCASFSYESSGRGRSEDETGDHGGGGGGDLGGAMVEPWPNLHPKKNI